MNIFKYPLDYSPMQHESCCLVRVLDIQIQNKRPVMWVIVDDEMPCVDVLVVANQTGTMWVDDDSGKFTYISTTQDNGFVAHWFVENRVEEYEDD